MCCFQVRRIACAVQQERWVFLYKAKRKILLVDDEEDILFTFKAGLAQYGFEVSTFSSALEALQNYKPAKYDLLILDIRMPGMSGIELALEVLKLDPSARICFLSALEVVPSQLALVFKNPKDQCVMKKPVAMNALVRLVKRCLGA